MLTLFPEGFEERDLAAGVELAAYADAAGEERMRAAFTEVRSEPVEPGWEDRWRAFHRGAMVGAIWVGPPWEAPPAGVEAVVIDPGRAFGTGSHPATRLCLELLTELPRGALLDAGCGSGVLAIAAARLGFAPVHAVDDDPAAVEAARRNAAANGVRARVERGDVLAGPLPDVASAVANLTHAAVGTLAPRLPRAALLTSGYLAADALVLPGRARLRHRELGGWAADVWSPQAQ